MGNVGWLARAESRFRDLDDATPTLSTCRVRASVNLIPLSSNLKLRTVDQCAAKSADDILTYECHAEVYRFGTSLSTSSSKEQPRGGERECSAAPRGSGIISGALPSCYFCVDYVMAEADTNTRLLFPASLNHTSVVRQHFIRYSHLERVSWWINSSPRSSNVARLRGIEVESQRRVCSYKG